MLNPSTSYCNLIIRALPARKEINSPLEDLLFVSDDNERKNYLRRFEHYLKHQQSFPCFRHNEATRQTERWQVPGLRHAGSPIGRCAQPTQESLSGWC